MTRVHVDPGICGFQALVEVEKVGKRLFRIQLTTECEKLNQLANQIEEMDLTEAFKQARDSKLYSLVADCLLHPACPVPVGIIKALEVEAELALACDIEIRFEIQ